MGAIVSGVANDLANGLLQFYVREEMLSQTTQDKPLMRTMIDKSETFPGGLGQISVPVQGVYMSDTAGFFAGYSEDDQLTFTQAQNMLRANYNWKEHHAGLVITWTELKKDGITISKGNKQTEHSKADLVRLTSVMKNRISDFGESWSRSVQHLFWMDGSQDAKAMPGLTSLILTDPSAIVVGGLDPATYLWWKNRATLNIVPDGDNQTLTRTLSAEAIQLKRYGGRISSGYMGSDFRNAMEKELRAKGLYTQSGFTGQKDLGVGDIAFNGIVYKYDPWLDDHGRSKQCILLDDRRVKLRPMENELNRIIDPERPYNYMIFARSMTITCAMQITQRNANGLYSVA